MQYVGNGQYGTVLLTHSFSHQLLTCFFVLVGIVLIAFFILFETTRKAQCQGVLLPSAGVIKVIPSQAGQIVEKRVKEGQSVQKGDILFVVSSDRSSGSVKSAQLEVSSLLQGRRDSFVSELHQSELQLRQRMETVNRRVQSLALESGQLDNQINLQTTRVSLAEQSYKRFEDLRRTNFISQAQLQEKQAELLDQRQRLADIRRNVAANQRELALAQADLRDLSAQGQRDMAGLKRNILAVEQDLTESEARREVLVRAAQDGTVTAITADIGQTVEANAALASLLPSGDTLEAEIYAPSRAAGFIQPGMQVMLRYQAYPYQKFGQHAAEVREVSIASLRPDELGLYGANANGAEPMYRIRLRLSAQSVLAYGRQMPLRPGMLVDASVHLEHRHLYEWVLEPLFSISGRL